MGFFNSSASSSSLSPLSTERLTRILDSMDLKYEIDDDGDIVLGFEHGYFYSLIRGESQEILQVRGIWYGTLPEDRHAGLSGMCEQWNRDKVWPKVYPCPRSDTDKYTLHTEHSIDYEYGATDEQLRQHFECAFATSNGFFSRASEIFPEGVAEGVAEEE